MTTRENQKQLADDLLDAIRRDDVDRVAALLEEGALAEGWWDAEEAAVRRRFIEEKMQASRQALAAQFSDLPLPDQLDPGFGAGFDAIWKGPSSHELPLHVAAEFVALACLRLLLDRVDPDQRASLGETALFAARTGAVIKMLAERGADLRATNQFGHDALRERLDDLEGGDEEVRGVCLAMLEAGVPLVHALGRESEGECSRLWHAAFSGNPDAVRFLLEAGHPVDADQHTTALHAICWQSDCGDEGDEHDEATRAIVQTLLRAGLSPDARMRESEHTPLHEAMSGDGSNLVAAAELLAAGADVNAINHCGQTPLHLSYETIFDYERVVPFMLEHGANPLIRDQWGQTVIDIARRMIAGEQPRWRIDAFARDHSGEVPCGWKHAADPNDPEDAEFRMLALLEDAAKAFE